MADIQEYSVSIKFKTEGTEKAARDTDKVKDSLGKLKSSTKSFDGLKSGFQSFAKGVGKVAGIVKGVTVAAGVGMAKAGKSAFSYSKGMMDYIETVNLFRASMGDLYDEAMKFVNEGEIKLGLNPQEMMDAISSFQNLSEGFGIASDQAYKMSKNMTQLAGDLSSFGNISFEQAQQKLLSSFSGQIKPMREYGIALDQASLQELAYSLGLEQKVKTMTRAQKTELIYYQIMKSSQKIQEDLGRTLMSPANALRVMQNEFKALGRAVGSIFIPIIQKTIPYIRMLTKVLTQAANAIATFFGFNIKDYTADVSGIGDGFGDVEDGIIDVGDAAEDTTKKMNKMLMPFDELNNITSNQGSGSGSGTGEGYGGSLGLDLPEYDMFANIDDRVLKFGDVLGKFEETAHKINELLRGIDWESIKETAAEWGTNLGEFVNIGVSEFDWYLIGESIAQGLNTVLTFVANFLETTDFEELGRAVNNLIQGFFENIEWDKVGNILSNGLTGALDLWLSVMANFDPEKVLEAVWKVLSNVDWGKLLSRLWSVFGVLIKNSPIVLMAKGIAKLYDLVINSIIDKLNNISFDLPDWLGGGHFGFELDYVDSTKDIDDFMNRAFLLEKYTEDVYQDTSDNMKKTTAQTWDEIEDKSFKGIQNVSENMEKIGEGSFFKMGADSVFGYNEGLESQQGKTFNIADKMNKYITESLNKANESKDWGEGTIKNYNDGLNSKLSIVTGAFDKIKTFAQENLNLTGQSNEWGSNTINSYNLGVETEENKTFNLFEKLNTTIQEKLNQATEAQKAGENTLNSYNQGISNSQSATSRLLEKLQTSIRTAFDNAQVARAEAEATGSSYSNALQDKMRAEAIKGSVKGSIKGMFASYNESYNWGADMVYGFRNGIDANKELVISKLREMANSIRSILHFSRPDEGPLRDYETWMPDMIKGLSDSLMAATPILDNTLLKVASMIAESLGNIELPDVNNSIFANQSSTSIIGNIQNKMSSSNKDEVTANMIRATYEAVSKALGDNKGTDKQQLIQVNVGNKELYRGYGQFQDEQSNMLGVTV